MSNLRLCKSRYIAIYTALCFINLSFTNFHFYNPPTSTHAQREIETKKKRLFALLCHLHKLKIPVISRGSQ